MDQLILNFISLQTILKYHLKLTRMLVSILWYGTNPFGYNPEGQNIASIVYTNLFWVEAQNLYVVSEKLDKGYSIY